MIASENGDVAVVKALLGAGPALQIDARDADGRTALHRASQASSFPVVEALLEARADVHAAVLGGKTPLFYASSAAIAKALLDTGADVNHKDCRGFTLAFDARNCEVMNTLINRNADVSLKAAACETVLMTAVQRQNKDILRLLLSTTASILNEQDSDGNTAIALAVRSNAPLEIIKMLIAAGADLSIGDTSGLHPLCLTPNTDIIRILLDAGADCNQQTHDGSTPLALMCKAGHADAVALLLARGASVDIAGASGCTPLMLAAQEGHLEVVEQLLLDPPPALLNARTQHGWTALFAAVHNRRSRIAVALLAAGADPNIADDGGYTPLMAALDVDIARQLLDGGADVNAHSHRGDTALSLAVSAAEGAALVALLLEHGADVAASRNDGWNALMVAASKNHVQIMQLVLQAPATPASLVDAQAANGTTALIAASSRGATAAVEALIAAGADVHLSTITGHRALHVVQNVDTARLLWNAGARDGLTNIGVSTLIYACATNKPDVVEFLLQCGLDPNGGSEAVAGEWR
jgi:ankyrin repeat protein